jgi:hypothetical protein
MLLDGLQMAASEATTGSILNPVMNLMSSMAKTLVGSTMASVSDDPTRLRGNDLLFDEKVTQPLRHTQIS